MHGHTFHPRVLSALSCSVLKLDAEQRSARSQSRDHRVAGLFRRNAPQGKQDAGATRRWEVLESSRATAPPWRAVGNAGVCMHGTPACDHPERFCSTTRGGTFDAACWRSIRTRSARGHRRRTSASRKDFDQALVTTSLTVSFGAWAGPPTTPRTPRSLWRRPGIETRLSEHSKARPCVSRPAFVCGSKSRSSSSKK